MPCHALDVSSHTWLHYWNQNPEDVKLCVFSVGFLLLSSPVSSQSSLPPTFLYFFCWRFVCVQVPWNRFFQCYENGKKKKITVIHSKQSGRVSPTPNRNSSGGRVFKSARSLDPIRRQHVVWLGLRCITLEADGPQSRLSSSADANVFTRNCPQPLSLWPRRAYAYACVLLRVRASISFLTVPEHLQYIVRGIGFMIYHWKLFIYWWFLSQDFVCLFFTLWAIHCD